MRLWVLLLVFFSGLVTIATAAAESDQAEMIDRMKAGGHILVTISAIASEGVSSGEGVLLKLNKDATYETVGRMNFGSISD
jgi:predicted RNA binding protein with dsRBD fold (UPF0201 family)